MHIRYIIVYKSQISILTRGTYISFNSFKTECVPHVTSRRRPAGDRLPRQRRVSGRLSAEEREELRPSGIRASQEPRRNFRLWCGWRIFTYRQLKFKFKLQWDAITNRAQLSVWRQKSVQLSGETHQANTHTWKWVGIINCNVRFLFTLSAMKSSRLIVHAQAMIILVRSIKFGTEEWDLCIFITGSLWTEAKHGKKQL